MCVGYTCLTFGQEPLICSEFLGFTWIVFLLQVVKQNVIENIVPILIAVKHKLEEQRSPLMKHLLLYLKELMKDYKNEVSGADLGMNHFILPLLSSSPHYPAPLCVG